LYHKSSNVPNLQKEMTSAIGSQRGREPCFTIYKCHCSKTYKEHASLSGTDLKDYQKMCLG